MNHLSDMSFTNIFSHSVGFLYILSVVSFVLQMFFSLISPISLFCFSLLWRQIQINIAKNVLPMFSAKSFVVPGLILSSLTHLGFIFVSGTTECSTFILPLIHVAVQLIQHDLSMRLIFSLVYLYLLCHRLFDYKYLDLFLGSLLCYIALCVCICPGIIPFR